MVKASKEQQNHRKPSVMVKSHKIPDPKIKKNVRSLAAPFPDFGPYFPVIKRGWLHNGPFSSMGFRERNLHG